MTFEILCFEFPSYPLYDIQTATQTYTPAELRLLFEFTAWCARGEESLQVKQLTSDLLLVADFNILIDLKSASAVPDSLCCVCNNMPIEIFLAV